MALGIPSVILPFATGRTDLPKLVDQTAALLAIAALKSFVDASQVTLDANSFVSAVTDQTGNANGYTQATVAQRPTVAGALNNRPAFRMAGTHRLDYAGAFPGSGDWTKFVVARPQTISTTAAADATGNTVQITSASGVTAGQYVSGPGVQIGTTVSGISGTTVTLSAPLLKTCPSGAVLAFTTAPAGVQQLFGNSLSATNKHQLYFNGTNVAEQIQGATLQQTPYDPTAFHLFVSGFSQSAQTAALLVDKGGVMTAAAVTTTTFNATSYLGNVAANNQGLVGDLACAGLFVGENLLDGAHAADLATLQAYVSAAYRIF